MKNFFTLSFLLILAFTQAQTFSGEVFMRDRSSLYLNQVYVTNLTTRKTVLTNYNGNFSIPANPGDVIRFTSIVSERKDVKISQEMLEREKNFVELFVAYYDIQEVVLNRFKPTGNLKKDVASLKSDEKNLAIAKMVGLPSPKGDGYSPILPVVSLNNGLAFNVESIYDVISGERKKKLRLQEFEKMNRSITYVKNMMGTEYFTKLKIPENMISNFLQFVYTSENLDSYIASGNVEMLKLSIEKYLPIYQKRLRNSKLGEIINSQ